MNNKLKDQNQLESDYRYLKGVAEAKTKEAEDLKAKLNSYE